MYLKYSPSLFALNKSQLKYNSVCDLCTVLVALTTNYKMFMFIGANLRPSNYK